MRWQPWLFALVYMVISLAVEAVMIAGFGLRVPADNRVIAPVVLTIPPLAATWISGIRKPRDLIRVALLTAVLTLVITLTVGRLTGIITGLLEPIINRFIAGLLAAIIATRWLNRST